MIQLTWLFFFIIIFKVIQQNFRNRIILEIEIEINIIHFTFITFFSFKLSIFKISFYILEKLFIY